MSPSSALAGTAVAPPARWRLVPASRPPGPGDAVPPFPADLVARPRLVRRLARDPRARLVLVVAPAGYGKTTLLSEWGPRDERPFPSKTLPGEHADPDRLRAAVDGLLEDLPESGPSVVVLDQADVVHSPEA